MILKKSMMDIVVSLDRNYLMPACIMLCSLYENNKDENITLRFLLGRGGEYCEKELRKICDEYNWKAFFYNIDESSLPQLPVNQHNQRSNIPTASYYRLFLTDILPSDIHKVLYMDCDMIVCQSIKELWDVDLEGYGVAVVPDLMNDNVHLTNRLKYDSRYGYFNGGLLLINLDFWRRNRMKELFIDYIRNNFKNLYFQDQDVMNYFFHDKKKELPLKWNFQTTFLWKNKFRSLSYRYHAEIEETCKHPGIVHYTEDKPWFKNSPNPMKDYFYKYRDMTSWKGRDRGMRPISLKNRLIHFLICLKRRKVSFYRSNYDENLLGIM